MKILFFIRTLNNSAGTEKLTTLLANYFISIGHNVSILCWKGGVKQFFPTDHAIKLYSLFDKDDLNIYKTYGTALARYVRFLKANKQDVVIDICTASSLLSIPALKISKGAKRLISWEHFNTAIKWNRVTSDLSRYLVGKFADSVIVLTDTDKRNFEQKYFAKKVTRILNPAPETFAKKSDLTKETVVAIGRFTHQKGFDMLLRVWKIVIDSGLNWKLKIIGDGELKLEILNLAKELVLDNHIEFVLPTLHIQQHYLDASVFVLSSRFEGLPLVLLEAKGYGLPVVSFDCETGPRDVVIDGVDGFLVPTFDVSQFAERVIQLINDDNLRKEFGANALIDVERFSLDKFYNAWTKQLSSFEQI